jgi:hypothetical protein
VVSGSLIYGIATTGLEEPAASVFRILCPTFSHYVMKCYCLSTRLQSHPRRQESLCFVPCEPNSQTTKSLKIQVFWDVTLLLCKKFRFSCGHDAFIVRVKRSKIILFVPFDILGKGSVILQNAWNFSPSDEVSHPRRLESSATLL